MNTSTPSISVDNETPQTMASDKYSARFMGKYLFSKDHQIVAKHYLLGAIFWALLGGLISVAFRIYVVDPAADLSWLKPLFGSWIGTAEHPERFNGIYYHAVVSIHGILMVYFVAAGALIGLAYYLVPGLCEKQEMASPKLSSLALGLYWFAGIALFFALFFQNTPLGGWRTNPILNALLYNGQASIPWLFGIILLSVAFFLSCLNIFSTLHPFRLSKTPQEFSIIHWSFYWFGGMGVLFFLLFGVVQLLNLSGNLLGGSILFGDYFGTGIEDLTAQNHLEHQFWFLGRPEMFLIGLPAIGIVSNILTKQMDQNMFGRRVIIWSMGIIGAVALVIWLFQNFDAASQAWKLNLMATLGAVQAIAIMSIAISWLVTFLRGGKLRYNPALLFVIGSISVLLTGGLLGYFVSNPVLSIEMHNSYYEVTYFHLVIGIGAMYAIFAAIYQYYPQMFGRQLLATLGSVHFWGTFMFTYLFLFALLINGYLGIPRGLPQFKDFETLGTSAQSQELITFAAVAIFTMQIIFLSNLVYCYWKGKVYEEQ